MKAADLEAFISALDFWNAQWDVVILQEAIMVDHDFAVDGELVPGHYTTTNGHTFYYTTGGLGVHGVALLFHSRHSSHISPPSIQSPFLLSATLYFQGILYNCIAAYILQAYRGEDYFREALCLLAATTTNIRRRPVRHVVGMDANAVLGSAPDDDYEDFLGHLWTWDYGCQRGTDFGLGSE